MAGHVLCRRWASLAVKEMSLSLSASRTSSIKINFTSRSLHHTSLPPYSTNQTTEQPSTSDLHSLYLEQMNEIQAEREAIFGPSDPSLESHDISQVARAYTEKDDAVHNEPTVPDLSPEWDAEEAYAEREALFQFTREEKTAWASYGSTSNHARMVQMQSIKEALAQRERKEFAQQQKQEHNESHSTQFTHLNTKGDGVSMVDVGNKVSTRRIARARSVVVFPSEVMSAFESRNNELIGPKGPIFETARLAGIMGAK
jgi:hypothetical protein